MITRQLLPLIEQRMFTGKAIVVLGPRQTGKTTLVRRLSEPWREQTLWLTGEDSFHNSELAQHSIERLRVLVGEHRILVIDEAQFVPNIGRTLKLLVDYFPQVQVLATGSSAFELANQLNEPLTGRKWEYTLLPLATAEMIQHHGLLTEKALLHQRLIFGFYPEVVSFPNDQVERLRFLASSYLYKDALMHDYIRRPQLIEKLLRALALQLGSEVSSNELAQLLGADTQTVEKYIDLLEKLFIVFRLPSLARNARNELRKGRKVYFYDNGIRNAILNNFLPPESRNDVGALWENFFIAERRKWLQYQRQGADTYFWRTHDQAEIDYIEDHSGQLHAYELKWNPKTKVRFANSFLAAYPGASTQVVHVENYWEFL